MTDSESKIPVLEPTAAAARGGMVDQKRYFNREISWLEFNRRVLEEASKPNLPVLERLKFLSIFSTNLDEFFMIRVSGLKEQVDEGVTELSPDSMTAAEQLREITKRLRPMLKRQSAYLISDVLPELAVAGISIESYSSLTAKERSHLERYFRDNLFPILTPQSVDSSHPFPYISNLSLNLGLFVEPDREHTQKKLRHLYRQKRFARIKLPPSVSRLVPIGGKKGRYTLLEEVIAANAHYLFPNMKATAGYLFRVTRDADLEIREDEAGDLLRTLERELQRRRFRFPVRLEVSADMPDKMLKLLAAGVGLNDRDIYPIDGFVDIPDLMELYQLDRPSLKERPIPVMHPTVFADNKSIFDVLKKRDILLHHPYTAFSALTDFLFQAAEDPKVQAIKICLYRTGTDSPIVDALIRAADLGKQVTALVELKARFDEENNIEWARRLENEGVHVIYGVHTLKTHSKVMLVVRRERDRLWRYVHIATGNYNPVTARVYTDLGILTANEEIGEDATSLFNFLTGYSQQKKYRQLLIAPVNLRDRLRALVAREIKCRSRRADARIILKMNALTDEELIEDLYLASQSGVQIDLIVRGICALRPGVKGLSENIRVRSIVGRFLEHSRIYYFANGGKPESEELYIGSADWMMRNLDRRVEVVTPVLDKTIARFIKDTLLPAYLSDTVNARELHADGTYSAVKGRGKPVNAQMELAGLSPTV